jgi:hypothetical protein
MGLYNSLDIFQGKMSKHIVRLEFVQLTVLIFY